MSTFTEVDYKQMMTEMEDEISRLSQIENELTNEVEMWKEKYEALEWKLKQMNDRNRAFWEAYTSKYNKKLAK